VIRVGVHAGGGRVKEPRVGLRHAQVPGPEDPAEQLVETYPSTKKSHPVLFLVAGRDALPAGAPLPAAQLGCHLLVDPGVVAEPVRDELLDGDSRVQSGQYPGEAFLQVTPADDHLRPVHAEEPGPQGRRVNAEIGSKAAVPGTVQAGAGMNQDAVEIQRQDAPGRVR
jgi:hypothetical protein